MTAMDVTTSKPTYSIVEFCEAHNIGRTHLYMLWKAGQGPRYMHVGSRKMISAEAATDWRKSVEVNPAETKVKRDARARAKGLHTPGPWGWDDRHSGDGYAYVMPASGGILSTICRVDLPFPNKGQGFANARLIASAPDLLLAIQNVIASATDKASPEIAQAIAAARKATSEKTS